MKSVTKTCKIKLDIPKDRKQDVLDTFEQYTGALNYCVNVAWKPERKIVNKTKLHHEVYYPLREATDLPANLICSARNKASTVISAVLKKWGKKQNASKPEFKKFSAIQFDKRTLTIKNRSCTFSTLSGRVKSDYLIGDYQREMLDDPNYEFRTGTLTYKNGDFFLNITIIKPALIKKPKVVMGVDLGIKNIAVTSTGKFFKAGILKDKRRQFRDNKAKLQSKGTRSSKKLLKRLSGRENRFADWVLHNISKQIVDEAVEKGAQVIAFEDLTNIRKNAKGWRKNQRASINRWAFSKLQQYTQYKALEKGIDTVFVKPEYTSQKCSKCGHTEASNRKGLNFICKHCGYSLNSDYNASKNIGLKVLSGKSPDWTELPCKLALKTEHSEI